MISVALNEKFRSSNKCLFVKGKFFLVFILREESGLSHQRLMF